MQNLDSSIVHRNLDTKLKIGGLEALDLLIVLIFAAVMSLFFGSGATGFIFIFLLPLALLIVLYFVKRNKPDGYLKNLLRYFLLPGHYSASAKPINEINLLTKIITSENKND
ncbi:MAG: hypothetical protein ACJAS4_003056 [Bacteriovoracaceae bacterium]|jgi:hypothetical protein